MLIKVNRTDHASWRKSGTIGGRGVDLLKPKPHPARVAVRHIRAAYERVGLHKRHRRNRLQRLYIHRLDHLRCAPLFVINDVERNVVWRCR